MATINLGKVITDAQKEVLDRQSYDSVNSKLVISGDENVNGNLTANSIVENMSGYSFLDTSSPAVTLTYAGVVKNGNKLTIAIAGKINSSTTLTNVNIGSFGIPKEIRSKIYTTTIGEISNIVSTQTTPLTKTGYTTIDKAVGLFSSYGGARLEAIIYSLQDLSVDTDYFFRYENTILLSENLAV